MRSCKKQPKTHFVTQVSLPEEGARPYTNHKLQTLIPAQPCKQFNS